MDIEKLKQLQDKLNDESVAELIENTPPSFVQFSNSPTVQLNLIHTKTGSKTNQSARVLHNWAQQGVIEIDGEDKGKINRFSRLESIWLSIVIEARKFGLPLESLRMARKELFNAPIRNFSILKIFILDAIFRSPKILLISAKGNTNILSVESYSRWVATGRLPSHINLNLQSLLQEEYPNNSFNVDFGLIEPYSDSNKCRLLYYLKTGDFKLIKLYLTSEDVRLIENTDVLLRNTEIKTALKKWNFKEAVVVDNNDVEDIISCKL